MLIFQSLNNESSGRVQHAKPRHPQVKEMMISTAKYHGSLLHSAIESGRSAVFGAVLTAVKSRLSPEEVLFSPQPRVLTGCCGHQSDPRRCLLWRRSIPPQDVLCACPMCALLFCVQHRRSDHTAVLRRLPTLSSPHRCFTVGCRCPPSPVSSGQGLLGIRGVCSLDLVVDTLPARCGTRGSLAPALSQSMHSLCGCRTFSSFSLLSVALDGALPPRSPRFARC